MPKKPKKPSIAGYFPRTCGIFFERTGISHQNVVNSIENEKIKVCRNLCKVFCEDAMALR
jgi:hypothetical protein